MKQMLMKQKQMPMQRIRFVFDPAGVLMVLNEMQELFCLLQEGEEEEVGNLQLAWEMLEVAKVIYKRYKDL